MKKLLFIFILLTIFTVIVLILIFPAQKSPTNQPNTMANQLKIIRQPAVAGQFYPADKQELSQMIDDFLSSATTTKLIGQPQIIIVPHAGYVFSGATAAYGFKTLADQSYDTVIVLGPSHNYPTDGLALYNGDAISTPFGELAINKKLTEELITSNKNIFADNKIHEPEHSLEVQIPFLQKILANNSQLVLGLINSDDQTILSSVAESLKQIISQGNTLLVISSDLSHYPAYADALYSDNKIIDSILTKNVDDFNQTATSIITENRPNLDTCACGSSAIKIGMLVANQLNLTGTKLHYSNSGDVLNSGDKKRVVGYGSIVFASSSSPNLGEVPSANEAEGYRGNFLTESEKLSALALARNTLEKDFKITTSQNEDYKKYPIFSEKRGVFVTLKKGEELRGCIGLIEPLKTLGEGIIEMAEAAAFDDPRFLSLEKNELKDITIEISVLTPPQKISNPKTDIVLGRHGVIVRQGSRSGVFLPQVATETGWELDTFMSHLCFDKAGLPATCWTDGSTDIYIFEAQALKEKPDVT